MGLLSTFKKIGRAIDPTSSKSALGGVVKAALPFVPVVGGLASAAIDMKNAAKGSGGGGQPLQPLPAGVVNPTVGAQPAPPVPVATPLWKRPAVLIGAALSGVALLALVVSRRK